MVRNYYKNKNQGMINMRKNNKCWVIIYFKGQLFWEIFSLLGMRFKHKYDEEEIAYT